MSVKIKGWLNGSPLEITLTREQMALLLMCFSERGVYQAMEAADILLRHQEETEALKKL